MDIAIDGLTSRASRSDGRPVVRDARLVIAGGGFTTIVGPSGAGKSTLLDLVTGVVRPREGRVQIGRHLVHPSTRAARTRLRARFLATARQDEDLIDALTAAENIDLGQRLSGRRDAAFAGRVSEALGISAPLRSTRADRLSGGERRRVAVTRAIASGTEGLALDEPTSSLDSDAARRVRVVLRQSADVGRTVIAVTHDPLLVQCADTVVRVTEGTISAVLRRPTDQQISHIMDAA